MKKRHKLIFLIIFFSCSTSENRKDTSVNADSLNSTMDFNLLLMDTSSLMEEPPSQVVVESDTSLDTLRGYIVSRQIETGYRENCTGLALVEIEKKIDSLSYQDIYNMFNEVADSCSMYAEYSQFFGEIVFKVLLKYPEDVVDVIDKYNFFTEMLRSELEEPIVARSDEVNLACIRLASIKKNNTTRDKIFDALKCDSILSK